jgi:hypothetical protein
MSPRTRTTAVLLSSAALFGAGGPAAAQACNGPDPGHSFKEQGAFHGRFHGHHHWLAAKAAKLGVSPDALKTAIQAAKAQVESQMTPDMTWQQKRDAFVAAVAQQLNLPQDQVAAVFGGQHD